MRRVYVAVAAVVGIFLCVQLGALALVQPFEAAGYQTVENPQDPTNSLLYIVAILVATGVMLAAIKLDVEPLVRGLVGLSAAFIAYYVFSVLFPSVGVVGGVNVTAAVAAVALTVALLAYPEWYVIDAAGIVMGAGAAGLFGISFGLLPALLLLAGLAVYDAVSVYGTRHMLTLASGVMDLKLPVVLVIPLTLSYSFLDAETPEAVSGADATAESEPATPGEDEGGGEGEGDDESEGEDESEEASENEAADFEERDVFFIGLGDAVMPAIMVASAAFFSPESAPEFGVPGLALTLPALTAMLGTLAGLLVLMRMVMKGRAHAGLPLLNGGAIAGYLVGALASGVPLSQAIGLA